MLTSGEDLQFVGSYNDVFGQSQREMKVGCGEGKQIGLLLKYSLYQEDDMMMMCLFAHLYRTFPNLLSISGMV